MTAGSCGTLAAPAPRCTCTLYTIMHEDAPYRQSPASRRSESRAPRPHIRTSSFSSSLRVSSSAWPSGIDSSKPSSPVYLQDRKQIRRHTHRLEPATCWGS